MRYARIVFADFPTDEMTWSQFADKTDQEKVEFFAQWDYGEYHRINEEPASGDADTVVEIDGYRLSYNADLEYAGLEKILEEGE